MPALRRYYRGDELIAMRDVQAATTRYYRFDHQDTTQCLTNEAGAVTDRFAADAWGVEVKRTGNSTNRHWHVGNWGYYREPSSPLSYVRARYQHPRTARWLTSDPLDRVVRDRYRYADNNPVRHIDPSGALSVFAAEFCGAGFINSCCKGPVPTNTGCFKCDDCAKLEVKGTVADFCKALDDWNKREPPTGPGVILCLLNHLSFSQQQAKQLCSTLIPDPKRPRDKCMHCVTSWWLTELCGIKNAAFIGWCKERRDLTDCEESEFSPEDEAANKRGRDCADSGTNDTDLTCCYQYR